MRNEKPAFVNPLSPMKERTMREKGTFQQKNTVTGQCVPLKYAIDSVLRWMFS